MGGLVGEICVSMLFYICVGFGPMLNDIVEIGSTPEQLKICNGHVPIIDTDIT